MFRPEYCTAIYVKTNYDMNKEGLIVQLSRTIYIYRRPDGDKERQRIGCWRGWSANMATALHLQPDKYILYYSLLLDNPPLYHQSDIKYMLISLENMKVIFS